MSSVLLGIDDPVTGRELIEALEAAGHHATWVGALDVTPGPGRPTPDVLIVDGDAPGMDVAVVAAAWRRREPPPALLVLGSTMAARAMAERVNAPLATKPVGREPLLADVARLVAGARGDQRLSPGAALRALRVPGGGLPEDEAALIASGSRNVDVALVREALRPHMYDYASTTRLLERLLQRRVLGSTEARLAVSLDGGRTVRGAIDGLPRSEDDSTPVGALSSHQAARLLWALASSGAIALSPEPPPGHPTARLRAHVRARRALLAHATHYQVLDLELDATPAEILRATALAELRYGPRIQGEHDLGELAAAAAQIWEQIARARMVLGDSRLRTEYDATLVPHFSELQERRQLARAEAEEAERSFTRGQQFLGAGEVFRAVSELASAARRMPGHPDYEAYAAWGRYLADELRGGDRRLLASRERANAEAVLAGRLPWPRAAYALGLLCEAAGDAAGAIVQMREALLGDNRLGPARHALARLSGEAAT